MGWRRKKKENKEEQDGEEERLPLLSQLSPGSQELGTLSKLCRAFNTVENIKVNKK